MDTSLLTFLLNNPERSVPQPWDRLYDLRSKIIFYKNHATESVVVDLRSRVNLGGGMFHESSLWWRMTGNTIEHSRYCIIRRRYDQDHPFVLKPSCCCGPCSLSCLNQSGVVPSAAIPSLSIAEK
ncbi:hypothetical protein DITRI_Ditri16bG0153100 [Diplodiscus trichospermus]